MKLNTFLSLPARINFAGLKIVRNKLETKNKLEAPGTAMFWRLILLS